MTDTWTIKRVLDWTNEYLISKNCQNAKLSAEWLVGYVLQLTRIELYTNYDKSLSDDELNTLHDCVKRRAMGEPLQYISGQAAFRHITINVRKGVLIPRPETEVLVSELLARLPQPERKQAFDSCINEYGQSLIDGLGLQDYDAYAGEDTSEKRTITVADLCTGSGCIACSLAYEHPDIEVIATDISPDAVSLAQENAEILGLSEKVCVFESDLWAKIPNKYIGNLDAVISNPPYVPSRLLDNLPIEVTSFEPRVALDGGVNGLDFFNKIAGWSYTALRPGGVFAVELHEDCLDEAFDVAATIGFVNIAVKKDLAGKPRVLIAYTPMVDSFLA